eukprot:2060911-Pyramimonas_sp.AAC.1
MASAKTTGISGISCPAAPCGIYPIPPRITADEVGAPASVGARNSSSTLLGPRSRAIRPGALAST